MQFNLHSPGDFLASFLSCAQKQTGLALLTGESGSGKTRWCLELVDMAVRHGLRPGGLVSPSVFEGSRKVGIDLLDVTSGEKRRLAFPNPGACGSLCTASWQMVADTISWGNSILERLEACDFVILDEAGLLEFERGAGLVSGLALIDAWQKAPGLVVVRPSLLSKARQRWPWAQTIDLCAETRT